MGAVIDALFLERSSGGSKFLGYTSYNPSAQFAGPTQLYSDDVPFPLEAGLRLEISHKFDNDMTLAATYWGLQQWSVSETIYGYPYQEHHDGRLAVLEAAGLLGGLDNSLGYTYNSQIQNIELNAIFRLNPSDPYREFDWLCGTRYVYFSDNLILTGIDDYYGASEWLNYNTTNNLIGPQTGLLFVHGWSHFQWETGLKAGLMANVFRQHGTDMASNSPGLPPPPLRHFQQRHRPFGPLRPLDCRPLPPHRQPRAPLGIPGLRYHRAGLGPAAAWRFGIWRQRGLRRALDRSASNLVNQVSCAGRAILGENNRLTRPREDQGECMMNRHGLLSVIILFAAGGGLTGTAYAGPPFLADMAGARTRGTASGL